MPNIHRMSTCLLPQLSRALRDYARTIPGKAQLFINSYAKALEVIPRQLCDNAGFDATDVLNKLRQKHALSDGSGKVSSTADRQRCFHQQACLKWGFCRKSIKQLMCGAVSSSPMLLYQSRTAHRL